ncbi:MAG: hypothetical protein GWN40_05005 [Nitrosopumilaceae archaeon]|nr:hypothetical protein [Nitrosopumilaceae archaeon]NIV65518.1 hypothetical protein [Nitrosopumilaceae archaeon]
MVSVLAFLGINTFIPFPYGFIVAIAVAVTLAWYGFRNAALQGLGNKK